MKITLALRDMAIREIGCLACLLEGLHGILCEKHHLNEGDTPGRKRRGELFTVGLCQWHHVGKCQCPGKNDVVRRCEVCGHRRGPSWRHDKRLFIERYGDGDAFLAEQNRRIDGYFRGFV